MNIEKDFKKHDRNKVIFLPVESEELLELSVRFSGKRHKQLYVFDVVGDSGTLLKVFDNEGEHGLDKHGKFSVGQGANARTIAVVARNESGPFVSDNTSDYRIPDGSVDELGRPRLIGFEDGVDGNYRDVIVAVTIAEGWPTS